ILSRTMPAKDLPIAGRYKELFSDSMPFSVYMVISDSGYKTLFIQIPKGKADTSVDSNAIKWLGNENYGIRWLGASGTSKITGRPQVIYQKMRLSGDTLKVSSFNIFTGKNKGVFGEWKSKFPYMRAGATVWDSTFLTISADKLKTIFSSKRDTSVYPIKVVGDTICASLPATANMPQSLIKWT